MPRIIVSLSSSQKAALDEYSARQGKGISAIVRDALIAFVPDLPDDLPAQGDSLLKMMSARAFIDVRDGRCIVSRNIPLGRGRGWQSEAAINWGELEDEAAAAVLAQGGGAGLSGVYDCPQGLALLAEWE